MTARIVAAAFDEDRAAREADDVELDLPDDEEWNQYLAALYTEFGDPVPDEPEELMGYDRYDDPYYDWDDQWPEL